MLLSWKDYSNPQQAEAPDEASYNDFLVGCVDEESLMMGDNDSDYENEKVYEDFNRIEPWSC